MANCPPKKQLTQITIDGFPVTSKIIQLKNSIVTKICYRVKIKKKILFNETIFGSFNTLVAIHVFIQFQSIGGFINQTQ